MTQGHFLTLSGAQASALAGQLGDPPGPGIIPQWVQLADGRWISEKDPGYPFLAAPSRRVCVNFVGEQDRLAVRAGQAAPVWLRLACQIRSSGRLACWQRSVWRGLHSARLGPRCRSLPRPRSPHPRRPAAPSRHCACSARRGMAYSGWCVGNLLIADATGPFGMISSALLSRANSHCSARALTCGASTLLAAVFLPVVTDRKATRRIRDRSVGAVHSEAAGQEAGSRRVPQLTGKDRPDALDSKALPHLLWHRDTGA
jgi:hypothetical protein